MLVNILIVVLLIALCLEVCIFAQLWAEILLPYQNRFAVERWQGAGWYLDGKCVGFTRSALLPGEEKAVWVSSHTSSLLWDY